jgi:hypothetical protein
VYNWRLSPELKRDLKQEARKDGVPLSVLLERVVRDALARHPAFSSSKGADPGNRKSRPRSTRRSK